MLPAEDSPSGRQDELEGAVRDRETDNPSHGPTTNHHLGAALAHTKSRRPTPSRLASCRWLATEPRTIHKAVSCLSWKAHESDGAQSVCQPFRAQRHVIGWSHTVLPTLGSYFAHTLVGGVQNQFPTFICGNTVRSLPVNTPGSVTALRRAVGIVDLILGRSK